MDLRNPIPLSYKRNPEKGNGYSKSYQAKQTKSECVYCEKPIDLLIVKMQKP